MQQGGPVADLDATAHALEYIADRYRCHVGFEFEGLCFTPRQVFNRWTIRSIEYPKQNGSFGKRRF